MNNYLIGALALAATSTPGIANENEWLSMDSELESLRSFSTQADGPNLSGWIISSLRFAGDVKSTVPQADGTFNDIGGFNLDSIRLNLNGSVSDYSYKVSAELGDGDGVGAGNRTATLLDAYVDWTVGESVNLRMGNFRTPFVKSAGIDRNRTLFTDRSVIGGIYAGRQAGLQISGDFESVRWALSATNGLDATGDEFLITGRVEVDVLGNGVGAIEGAYGAEDEANLTIALAGSDDGGHDDGQAFAMDAQFTSGQFYASLEAVDYDDGTAAAFGPTWAGINGIGILGTTDVADTTPYAATVSYLIGEDQYEVAARYEESDNTNDDTTLTLGVNRYIHGHDIKWTFSYTDYSSDSATGDVDVLALSLAMGF